MLGLKSHGGIPASLGAGGGQCSDSLPPGGRDTPFQPLKPPINRGRVEDNHDNQYDAVVLLAGGRSRRYPPGDKALADVAGRPMCRRTVEGLPGEALVVSCRADQRSALAAALGGLDPDFAVDPVPDRGPLVGLRTALEATAADRALVVGCDMPHFDAATARSLLGALSDAEAALVDTDGPPRPLGAAYRVDAARGACRWTLEGGSRCLRDAVGRLDAAAVDAGARTPWDCNRPEDVEAVRRTIEGRTSVQ